MPTPPSSRLHEPHIAPTLLPAGYIGSTSLLDSIAEVIRKLQSQNPNLEYGAYAPSLNPRP